MSPHMVPHQKYLRILSIEPHMSNLVFSCRSVGSPLGMKNDKGETALLTVLNSPACLCGSKEGVRAARFLVNHGAVVDKEVHAIAGGLFTSAKGKGRSRGAAKKKSANKNVTIQHAPNVHGLEIQVPPKEKSTPDQSPGAGYTESPRSFA